MTLSRTDSRGLPISDKAGEARLSGAVYEQIFTLIASGELALNARLPAEAELARRFGASRPVIREALARLRDDGIIVSRQGSGSYVRQRPDNAVLRFVPVSSIADILRCFEFRVGLEGAAAALAAVRAEERDIAEIRSALEDLEASIEARELGADADVRFHLAVAKATHNQYHLSVQNSLQSHIAAGMHLARSLSLHTHTHTRLQLVQEEHVAVLEAIESRDSLRARAAMEIHVNNARYRMFQGVSQPDM
jgi:GntR family transcriptional regulator, transcriptional repressor for pyruvate dehydrogenase complex